MAGELPDYTAFLHERPCCAPGCGTRQDIQAHHTTNGLMMLPGTPPPRGGPRRGKGQRCHDYYQIPLCLECHGQFHDSKGQFRTWSKQRKNAWQLEMVTYHRCLYEEQQGTQEWLDSLPF